MTHIRMRVVILCFLHSPILRVSPSPWLLLLHSTAYDSIYIYTYCCAKQFIRVVCGMCVCVCMTGCRIHWKYLRLSAARTFLLSFSDCTFQLTVPINIRARTTYVRTYAKRIKSNRFHLFTFTEIFPTTRRPDEIYQLSNSSELAGCAIHAVRDIQIFEIYFRRVIIVEGKQISPAAFADSTN